MHQLLLFFHDLINTAMQSKTGMEIHPKESPLYLNLNAFSFCQAPITFVWVTKVDPASLMRSFHTERATTLKSTNTEAHSSRETSRTKLLQREQSSSFHAFLSCENLGLSLFKRQQKGNLWGLGPRVHKRCKDTTQVQVDAWTNGTR